MDDNARMLKLLGLWECYVCGRKDTAGLGYWASHTDDDTTPVHTGPCFRTYSKAKVERKALEHWAVLYPGIGQMPVSESGPSAWLTKLGYELRTQNNACTAHPLFLVQKRRRIFGMDSGYADEYEWHSCHDAEYKYSQADIQEAIRDDPAADADRNIEDDDEFVRDPEDYGYEKVYYIDEWRFVTAHFTRKAAQRYLNENAHNMTAPRIYVSSQYRCHEWNKAVEHLSTIGE